jgi:hypothetical protein
MVPACYVVQGTGTAPADKAIWVAERATGDEHRGFFSPTKAEIDSPGHWHATLLLGASGVTFNVVVFLLDDESSGLLENLQVEGKGAYPVLRTLPVNKQDSKTVTRDRDNTASCDQGSP